MTTKVCKFYRRDGYCRYGNRCHFIHEDSSETGSFNSSDEGSSEEDSPKESSSEEEEENSYEKEEEKE